MNRNTFKANERFWAEQLGGKRIPVSGRVRGDQPDVEHPLWSIECKCGKTLSTRLQDGMDQAVKCAGIDSEGSGLSKTPLLCITHNRRGNQGSIHWVAMRLEDFKKWYVK